MSVKKFKIFDGNKKVGSMTCSEKVAKIMQEAFKQSDAPKVEIKEVTHPVTDKSVPPLSRGEF